MAEQELLEYRPPFKGTEIRILKFSDPDDLELDFRSLELKAERAYNKLNEMDAYVYSPLCRQQYILKYFGEADPRTCGRCDNCLKQNRLPAKEYLGDY